ncbi:hypothetical protein C8J56DRAFT_961956 [Mycena floridula]|nr:hypothetical protein C8J56DRAFT_961956 [Mycena floridula]
MSPQICANCAYAGDSPTSDDIQLDRQQLNAANSELTNVETREVIMDLAAQTARLELVNEQIAVLRDDLESFEAEQRHLQHIIAEDKLILRPIRKVPRDILRVIFLLLAHAAMTKTPTPHSTLSTQKFMPWRLAQVSRTWRDVALTYPALWSTIILTDDNNDFDVTSRRVQQKFNLLGVQLRRAADNSLDIHITSSRPLQPLIYLLLPTSPRWHSLSILLPYDTSVLSAIIASTPRLEKVNFSIMIPNSPTYNSSIFAAPPSPNPAQFIQLQSFIDELLHFSSTLHSVEGDLHLLTGCHLPWRRIHSYCEHRSRVLQSASRQDFHGLAQMINLQSCELFCNFDPGSSSSVILPNLRHLVLDGGSSSMVIVLNGLSLPRLCTLKIAELPNDDSFTSLLPRYSALKGLHIAGNSTHTFDTPLPLPVNGLIAILDASPNLIALVLDLPHEHLEFVDRLVNEPTLAHGLTFLSLHARSITYTESTRGTGRRGRARHPTIITAIMTAENQIMLHQRLAIARPSLRVQKAASDVALALPPDL